MREKMLFTEFDPWTSSNVFRTDARFIDSWMRSVSICHFWVRHSVFIVAFLAPLLVLIHDHTRHFLFHRFCPNCRRVLWSGRHDWRTPHVLSMTVKYARVSSVRLCGQKLSENRNTSIRLDVCSLTWSWTRRNTSDQFSYDILHICQWQLKRYVNHYRTKCVSAVILHGMIRSCVIYCLNLHCLFAVVFTCGGSRYCKIMDSSVYAQFVINVSNVSRVSWIQRYDSNRTLYVLRIVRDRYVRESIVGSAREIHYDTNSCIIRTITMPSWTAWISSTFDLWTIAECPSRHLLCLDQVAWLNLEMIDRDQPLLSSTVRFSHVTVVSRIVWTKMRSCYVRAENQSNVNESSLEWVICNISTSFWNVRWALKCAHLGSWAVVWNPGGPMQLRRRINFGSQGSAVEYVIHTPCKNGNCVSYVGVSRRLVTPVGRKSVRRDNMNCTWYKFFD